MASRRVNYPPFPATQLSPMCQPMTRFADFLEILPGFAGMFRSTNGIQFAHGPWNLNFLKGFSSQSSSCEGFFLLRFLAEGNRQSLLNFFFSFFFSVLFFFFFFCAILYHKVKTFPEGSEIWGKNPAHLSDISRIT